MFMLLYISFICFNYYEQERDFVRNCFVAYLLSFLPCYVIISLIIDCIYNYISSGLLWLICSLDFRVHGFDIDLIDA